MESLDELVRWSHCMGDEPKKNDGLIVWVTYPRKMMYSLFNKFSYLIV